MERSKKEADLRTPEEAARVEARALKNILSTPPQPKPKKDASATPKKRGRPKKEK